MGKIKAKAIKEEDKSKSYTLSEREFNYVKILNIATQYNTMREKLVSGFLYYVCTSRFGYAIDANLMFEIDLDQDTGELKVTEVQE